MLTDTIMVPPVQTMSLPYANPLLDPTTAAAQKSSSSPSTALATAPAATMATQSATGTTTYTTPRRQAGLAAVTPASLPGTPGDGEGGSEQQQHSASQTNNNNHEGDGIVSASSTDETATESAAIAVAAASPVKQQQQQAPPAASSSTLAQPPTMATIPAPAIATTTKKISIAPTPSIHLGPRVTPALRKSPPKTVVKAYHPQVVSNSSTAATTTSPVKPRNLDVTSNKFPTLLGMNHAQQQQQQQPSGKCPSTPAAAGEQGNNNIPPPPSSFLAAKISPMRSRKNEDKKAPPAPAPAAVAMAAAASMPEREKTPPPQAASADLDPTKLTPGIFLSPRTPKATSYEARPGGGMKTTGMTPRSLIPGLTPTNFASDFGKGQKEEGSLGALDASNVFAWLQSPGGQGLFTPGGGLNTYSVTNTPRGMYGFTGPAGSKAETPGRGTPKLAPTHPFFAGLEAGGDLGVNTPKIHEGQRSMICISPLASKKKNKQNGSAMKAPETPMSINFSEVFASPRYPTPRLSSRAARREDGMSSSDAHLSPVASALHTAERDINLDDDLNALLQLAETATPGGRRPMTFMSPLLTHSLGRVTNVKTEVEPPSSLQLPIILGSSLGGTKGSTNKMRRNGSSPPQLSIRSTSGSSPPIKSSLKKKSRKRKSPTEMESMDQYQQQQTGYAHSSPTMHHPHPHAAHAPSPAHQGYYHHPGYQQQGNVHQMSYPSVPQPAIQHYAYGTERQKTIAALAASTAPSPTKISVPSPPKPTLKAKRSRGRPKSNKRSVSRQASDASKSDSSRPTTPSTTSTGKRVRKSTARAASNSSAPKKSSKNAVSDPADKERIAAAIIAVNTVYGDGTEKDKKLAAATLRGVTMRPSGKWQAQLYYAGKSRYIGVFDSKEKASLAYELAREVLKTDDGKNGPTSAEETDRNVSLARKAAFAGITEHAGK